jgi:hypothetical protein
LKVESFEIVTLEKSGVRDEGVVVVELRYYRFGSHAEVEEADDIVVVGSWKSSALMMKM